MTTPAESPHTLQLLRLVKASIDDGYRHQQAAPPPDDLAKALAIAGIMKDQEGQPHQAVLCAYFYARCQAAADPAAPPSARKPSYADLKQATQTWLAEREKERPAPAPAQPGYFHPELLHPIILQALNAGRTNEQSNAVLGKTSADKAADILLKRHPDDPQWAVILAYFGSRAQVLANNLGRRPGEEPDRWLGQALANWLQEFQTE